MRLQRTLTLGLTAAVCTVTCKSDRITNQHNPPRVDAGVDLRAYSGSAVSVTARITTSSASQYRWTLSWGDGSADSGGLSTTGMVTPNHTYTAVGQYALRLSARGPFGVSDTGSDTLSAAVAAPGTPEVFIGAGDIGECGLTWVAKTAAVIDTTPGTVFTLGDNVYPSGRAVDYANCYTETWGTFKKRTHPTPGNHEFQEYFHDTTADGYFGYFGVAAHDQPIGDYSYDVGSWHIIVLNSSFEESLAAGRALSRASQLTWLGNDLATHPALCTLAMWHHPRFSSGTVHGNDTLQAAFWRVLYDAGADVVLVGHEHNYERFAPQTADGVADPARGIREFVVGTGGSGFDPLDTTKVGQVGNSEVGGVDHGVLKLTLSDAGYHWQFIPVGYTLGPNQTPRQYSHTDSGTASCH